MTERYAEQGWVFRTTAVPDHSTISTRRNLRACVWLTWCYSHPSSNTPDDEATKRSGRKKAKLRSSRLLNCHSSIIFRTMRSLDTLPSWASGSAKWKERRMLPSGTEGSLRRAKPLSPWRRWCFVELPPWGHPASSFRCEAFIYARLFTVNQYTNTYAGL